MTDLTKYSLKAVNQLLNANNEFRRLLPTATNEDVKQYLNSRYKLTKHQIKYIISQI